MDGHKQNKLFKFQYKIHLFVNIFTHEISRFSDHFRTRLGVEFYRFFMIKAVDDAQMH